MAFSSAVTQDAAVGNPLPSIRLAWQDTSGGGIPTYAARDFGISTAVIVEFTSDWRVNSVADRSRAGWGMFRTETGQGVAVAVDNLGGGNWRLSLGTAGGWQFYGSMVQTSGALAGLAANTWFRMKIRAVINPDDTTTVTATVLTTADVVIGSVSATLSVARGEYCGFYGTFDQLGGTSIAWFDNINVKASGSTGYVPDNVATNYVYTFVNDLGEESAPSPVSADILRPNGVSVTVTTPTTTPTPADAATYSITHKRIYRAVSGATGTLYRFIAEITLATATYLDEFDDGELLSADVLESEEYDMPPADLQGLIVLPIGSLAGFSKNRLCISAIGRPHAWPVRARYPVDTDIVAIGNIDNTIVLGTQKFVYTATGQDPFSYSMSQPGAPQACLSKPGMVFLDGQGMCFPSPDGYQVCRGSASSVSNLTEGMFSQEQWQALNPETIKAAVHDGVLHFHYEGDAGNGSYAIDLRATGSGLTRMSFHATALHVDPMRDALFMALDAISEPDDPALPVRPSFSVAARTIYQFNAHATAKLVYQYRSKLNQMPIPTSLQMAQVRAGDYTNLLTRFYGDGAEIKERVITGKREFSMQPKDAYDTYEYELIGTSRVRTLVAAEDVEELV